MCPTRHKLLILSLLSIYIEVPSAVCPLPWTLNAPKSRPMDSSDRTAHDWCRPIRSLQDVTSLRRTRNHMFWFTMGLAPSILQSLITQQILPQSQAYWAYTTANYVPFTLVPLRLLYVECSQSRTLFAILSWGCTRALLRQILHFCTEASRRDKTCQLLRAPSQPFLWLRSTSPTVQWHVINPTFSEHRGSQGCNSPL